MKSQSDTDSAVNRKNMVLRWEWEVFFLFAIITAVLYSVQTRDYANGIMALSGLTAIVVPILMALRRLR